MNIYERCSCGAEIKVTTSNSLYQLTTSASVRDAVDRWRRDHRCNPPEPEPPPEQDSDHTGYLTDAQPTDTGLGFVPDYASDYGPAGDETQTVRNGLGVMGVRKYPE